VPCGCDALNAPGFGGSGSYYRGLWRHARRAKDSGFLIVLDYNGAQITLNCVDPVLKIDYPNFRVTVVDNASTAALTQRKGPLWTRSLLC
jgi:hypothetical protein